MCLQVLIENLRPDMFQDFLNNVYLFMYLFSAVLVFVAVWPFSSCGQRGLLSS